MVIGMSSCGRSESGADSDSDAVKTINSSKATGDLTIWAMGNEGDLLDDFVKDSRRRTLTSRSRSPRFHGPQRTINSRPPSLRATVPTLRRWAPPGWPISPTRFPPCLTTSDMSDFSDGSRLLARSTGNSSACLGTSTPECCTTVPTSPGWLVGTKLRRLGMSLSGWPRTCRRSTGQIWHEPQFIWH